MDDRELFQTMLINKEKLKLGQKFFEERIKEKYPSVIKFKPENTTWSKYYFETIRDISKLKEEKGLDFPRKYSFHSLKYYLGHNIKGDEIVYEIIFVVYDDDEKKVFSLLDNIIDKKELIEEETGENEEYYLQEALLDSIVSRNIPLYLKIKEKYKEYANFFDHLSEDNYEFAILSEDKSVIDYIFNEYKEKHLERFQEFVVNAILTATNENKFEIYNYIKEKYPIKK